MNKNMEQEENKVSIAINEALLKNKKNPVKEGVDLLGITKKLSSKKFGKKKV